MAQLSQLARETAAGHLPGHLQAGGGGDLKGGDHGGRSQGGRSHHHLGIFRAICSTFSVWGRGRALEYKMCVVGGGRGVVSIQPPRIFQSGGGSQAVSTSGANIHKLVPIPALISLVSIEAAHVPYLLQVGIDHQTGGSAPLNGQQQLQAVRVVPLPASGCDPTGGPVAPWWK